MEIDERFRDVLESEEFGGSSKGKTRGNVGESICSSFTTADVTDTMAI